MGLVIGLVGNTWFWFGLLLLLFISWSEEHGGGLLDILGGLSCTRRLHDTS
jgi:hypothetical protein